MLAARTLSSGLMVVNSPARPWFRLGIGSPSLSEVPEIRAWLAVAYEELGVFGTATVVAPEDCGTPSVNRWFARPDGSLFCFAGIWRTWTGDRGTKTKPDVGQHTVYSFLTTDPAEVVKPIHDKATPLILTSKDEIETWLTGSAEEALALQKPAKPGVIVLLPLEQKAA